jgi:hypothetical protein
MCSQSDGLKKHLDKVDWAGLDFGEGYGSFDTQIYSYF